MCHPERSEGSQVIGKARFFAALRKTFSVFFDFFNSRLNLFDFLLSNHARPVKFSFTRRKMRTGKRILGMTGILCVALWVIFSANVFAQEESSTGSNATIAGENEAKSTKDWKQEISSDVRDIKQDRE